MLGVALEFKNKPDTTTPINATNLNDMQKLLVDLIYPVGSYYDTSDGEFDPNVKWGGTWELDLSGTVLVSKSSSSSSKFNATVGTIVGEEEHALTVEEMPSHSHPQSLIGINRAPNGAAYNWVNSSNNRYLYSGNDLAISTGGDQPHNNIQPSKIINRWHRTA